MDGLLYEPLKYYTTVAKERHARNLSEYFDSLVKESKIDVEANRKTVGEYDAEMAKVTNTDRLIGRYKLYFGLLIALGIVGGAAPLCGLLFVGENLSWGVGLIIGGAIAATCGFLMAFLLIKPKIKNAELIRAKHRAAADKLYGQAMLQMAPLNAAFDNRETLKLIEKTMPQIKFSERYSNEEEHRLIEEFDYIDMTDDETSVLDSLSGTLMENPFLFERYLSHDIRPYVYHGTLVIRWRETRMTDKGVKSVSRVQTLHASLEKPKPFYNAFTHLGYGSQAAPDLSFSRTESDTDELSDKALERRIKRGEKKLKEKARKNITRGGNFQEMSNSEFDVLFGAANRDHEVQFRLIFTPLAQTNTVDLLRSKEGYGDDFNFIKQGKFNIIKSNHAQKWDMNPSAKKYISHSVDLSKKLFSDYNNEYFKSIFFDFAPLLAIPAYHEEPSETMREPKTYIGCYPQYEHEALANAIGERAFAHEAAETPSILKTTMIEKQGDVDRVCVNAFAYRTEKRMDFVPVLGGDGHIHPVPVHWVEYIPVCKSSEMLVKSIGYTEKQLRDKNVSMPERSAYLHGIMAYSPVEKQDWSVINKVFEKIK